MWPDGAFTVLLLISSVTALTVPPPTDVTVSCRNLRVVVNWEFSDQQPHTSFRVETQSSDVHLVNVTTEHQYDLSGFIWKSQDHYMGFHSVTVTALQEGGESTPVPSESFTFNKERTADKHCALDFPPVEVVAGDSGNIVSFPNPFHFYTELKQPKEKAFFKFNVSSDQRNYTQDCRQSDSVCRLDLDLDHGEETCVRVGGWLDDGNGVERVEFIRTGRICPSNTSDAHVFTFVFLLIALVLIISGLAIAIYKVRAWALQEPEKTEALTFDPNKEKPGLLEDVEEDISPVVVMEPGCSSSVSSEVSSEDGGACCMYEGRPERGEEEPADQEPADQEPADQEPADQEPAAVGNYDRRHVLLDVRVDLGDGEMTDAYREG